MRAINHFFLQYTDLWDIKGKYPNFFQYKEWEDAETPKALVIEPVLVSLVIKPVLEKLGEEQAVLVRVDYFGR